MTRYDGWMVDYRDLDDKDLIEMRLQIDAELRKRGMRLVDANTCRHDPIPNHGRIDADTREVMIKAIASHIAKREHGESYVGYESGHAEAAADYVGAVVTVLSRPI